MPRVEASGARIVMLCTDGRSSRVIYHALQAKFGVSKVLMEPPVSKRRLLFRRAKRLGVKTVVGQLAFQAGVQPVLERTSRSRIREILHAAKLCDSAIPEEAVEHVSSVNDTSAIDRLVELQPALVFISGTRILSKNLLSKMDAPIVNIHAGITPLYRGVHGAYWALVEGDVKRCGVTVHLVDAGIDTGRVLAHREIRPTPQDSFVTYPYLQLAAGVPAALEAVEALLAGQVHSESVPTNKPSKLWHHPTLWSYARNRWLRGVA
jgi:methionyl-tRNA formyltransferase